MESEEAAKDALFNLKTKARKLCGEAVKARVKTDTVVRSYYSQPSPAMGAPVDQWAAVCLVALVVPLV